MADSDSVKLLADLGFTHLEAEIYTFLLQESPVTGYRIAQAIGKPAANTYKAIQTLELKGAVLVEEGTSRMCRAVSAEELINRLGREFQSKSNLARQSLSQVGQPTRDERIYQIRSKEQLFQQVREMIGAAKQVILGTVVGQVVPDFAEEFLAAVGRGVDVVLKSDRTIRIEGVEVVPDDPNEWGCAVIQIAVDGDQMLMGSFNRVGKLTQAFWSRNPLIAVSSFKGLSSDICLSSLAIKIEEGAGPKRISRTLDSYRLVSETTGFDRLSS